MSALMQDERAPLRCFDWERLDATERRNVLLRPDSASADPARVTHIIERVEREGDAALRALTASLDGVELDALMVTDQEFDTAADELPGFVRDALVTAADTLGRFHRAQRPEPVEVETRSGVSCRLEWRPIRSVGLYVPAGSAPLPSTALMLGVPAAIAGCPERVVCTPPRPDGSADAAVLCAARMTGIRRVFKLGGAQAIAAMGVGTETVPRVDKLFGPGNPWVTEAKRQIAGRAGGAALDMPAGPSEVMVVADGTADPRLVAADLLSQAEHGADSQVVLVALPGLDTTDVQAALLGQLETLPRAEVAARAVENGRALCVPDRIQALEVVEAYAPEHLILMLEGADAFADDVTRAGSVFVGPWAPESIGDYVSGTNHVLPTHGHAAACGSLSLMDFLRSQTRQTLSREGLEGLAPSAVALARWEGLEAHARAIELRLEEGS